MYSFVIKIIATEIILSRYGGRVRWTITICHGTSITRTCNSNGKRRFGGELSSRTSANPFYKSRTAYPRTWTRTDTWTYNTLVRKAVQMTNPNKRRVETRVFTDEITLRQTQNAFGLKLQCLNCESIWRGERFRDHVVWVYSDLFS